MAGAGPTNLHYCSSGLRAAYCHPGSLGPLEPCPSGPWVTINLPIRESVVEAREEGRHSGRRMGTVDDMEDIVSFCEGYAENDVISEYPRKNLTKRSQAAAITQRPSATANAVRQNRPRRMGDLQWK